MLKFIVVLVTLIYAVSCGKEPKDCEVCEFVINKLRDQLPSDAKQDEIEVYFKDYCKTATGKEERFCYYVGGLDTSATYIIPEMSKPMSWGMPADKICREKLYKKDAQICDLKLDKQIDINSVDLKTLKVKDLKKILNDWGEDTRGFTEKSDFIRRIEEVKHLYVKSDL